MSESDLSIFYSGPYDAFASFHILILSWKVESVIIHPFLLYALIPDEIVVTSYEMTE
jgi:hypothetical protein